MFSIRYTVIKTLLFAAATCQLATTAPIVRRECAFSPDSTWAHLRDGLFVAKRVSFRICVTISV